MRREDIEMATVQVYGYDFEVPKAVADAAMEARLAQRVAEERETALGQIVLKLQNESEVAR